MPAQFVYVLHLNDLCKIGRTNDPVRRMSGMQLPGKPDGTYYRVPDSRAAERELHERFKAKRVYGEWFRLNEADLSALEETIAPKYLRICT